MNYKRAQEEVYKVLELYGLSYEVVKRNKESEGFIFHTEKEEREKFMWFNVSNRLIILDSGIISRKGDRFVKSVVNRKIKTMFEKGCV
jgi:hypothetical protein